MRFGGQLFRQTVGIPNGTNCASLLDDLFLYSYENEFYCIKFLSAIGNLLWFWTKKWVEILIVPSFRLKFDDITVTLSLIVLS